MTCKNRMGDKPSLARRLADGGRDFRNEIIESSKWKVDHFAERQVFEAQHAIRQR